MPTTANREEYHPLCGSLTGEVCGSFNALHSHLDSVQRVLSGTDVNPSRHFVSSPHPTHQPIGRLFPRTAHDQLYERAPLRSHRVHLGLMHFASCFPHLVYTPASLLISFVHCHSFQVTQIIALYPLIG